MLGILNVVAEFEEAGVAVEVGFLPQVGTGCEGAARMLVVRGMWEDGVHTRQSQRYVSRSQAGTLLSGRSRLRRCRCLGRSRRAR